MATFREMCQRARDRAGAPTRTYRNTLTDRLYSGPLHVIIGLFYIYVGDRICLRCNAKTSYVTNRTYRHYRETGALRCGCGGRLLAAYEKRLIEILTDTAEAVQPDVQAGLARIRAQTNGAPMPGGAAVNDDDLGSQTS